MHLPVDTALLPKPTIGKTAESHLRTLLENLKVAKSIAKDNMQISQELNKDRQDLKAKPPSFSVGDRVLMTDPTVKKGHSPKLSLKWSGPYTITALGPNHTFKLQHSHTGKVHKSLIHADRLKTYTERAENADMQHDAERPEADHESRSSSPEPQVTTNPPHDLDDTNMVPSQSNIIDQEYWVHTYEVKIPAVPGIPTRSGCHQGNSTCALLNQIQMHLNVIKTKCVSQLTETRQQLMQLIPESKTPSSTRTKRAVLSFVGSLSKTLFGTATTNDVNILAQHINALTKQDINVAHTLQQHSEHLSSFMKLVDTRFKNAIKGVKANHEAIRLTARAMEQNVKSIQSTFVTLTSLLIDQIQKAYIVEHQLEELKLGILDLAKNKLSPLLIPPQILQQTIHHLSTLLSKKYPSFRLLQTTPAFYYSNAKFIYARAKSYVFISIKFPISSIIHSLQLYKIISLPLPINGTSAHTTQLLDMPDYLALSQETQHYVNLDSSTLASCNGDENILHCPFHIALQSFTKPSCPLALFQNDKIAVKTLCDFRYITKPQPPQLIPVDASHVLVYRIPFLKLHCPNSHRMIPGCTFCVIVAPCYCSLSTEEFFYPASFGSCDNTTKHITHLYPVNLALLQHFFDSSVLSTIAGDTHFKTNVNFTIPNFNIYSHEYSTILANDNKAHLSLKLIAESAKKDKTIFKTIAEPLIDGQIPIQTSWLDTSSVLAVTAAAVSGVAIILVCCMFFKIRTLSAALTLVTCVGPVKAVLPPALNYNDHTPPNSGTASFVLTDLADYHVSILLGLITLAIASILLLLLYQQRSGPRNGLVLELTSGSECVAIPVISLTLCPSYWDIQSPLTVENLHIAGYFFPTLSVNWPGFIVTNQLTKTSITIPNTIRISYFNARQLQKIFKQPFSAYLLLVHNNLYTILEPPTSVQSF
ncbi:uncharacterized protein [Haliotis cracherodii]|uniref:uncharacterized protein n=1 Tax=Haliotis cracherodii TaxID=6455 RepID=UPI0039EAF682